MFNAAKSESVAIAEAIASALGSRYYDTKIVGNDTEAILCTHYDVTDAEWSWQNGCRTRFIRVISGVIETDIDDYFESSEQKKGFGWMMEAYARLCPSIDNAEKCAEEVIVEGCPLDDEDIPF